MASVMAARTACTRAHGPSTIMTSTKAVFHSSTCGLGWGQGVSWGAWGYLCMLVVFVCVCVWVGWGGDGGLTCQGQLVAAGGAAGWHTGIYMQARHQCVQYSVMDHHAT
jgi:hypothetical protein